MRSKTAIWFECTVAYGRMTDDGSIKTVTEKYSVDALSFTEAEARITEEMAPFITGNFTIKAIKRTDYSEILFSDKERDDKFYKVKTKFITIDEKSDKEKKQTVIYLVQAHTPDDAITYFRDFMGKTAIDYELTDTTDTRILDVFEHNG